MKNFILYLFFGIAFVTMTTNHANGDKAATSLDFQTLKWIKNWDFKARELTTELGPPSKVDIILQPRIHRLDFYGFLGSFPSANKDTYVGFAQAFTPLKENSFSQKITIETSSSTPDLVFHLVLKTSNNQNCNYQSTFKTTKKKKTIEFTVKDFDCVRRGSIVADSDQVNFNDVDTLGFMVTRSSQTKSIATVQTLLAFSLDIYSIKIL